MSILRRRLMATEAASAEVIDFPYTGQKQKVSLSAGTYKIECWGAQGGSVNSSYEGGKGGYSVGILTLTQATDIYVYSGGQGGGGTAAGVNAGGFNGGGQGYSPSSTYACCGGGGASDVRVGQDSLYARVIVAGGGGGSGSYNASNRYKGGYGGGTTGGTPSQYSSSFKAGNGGTQSSGGKSYHGTAEDSTTYGTLAGFGVGAAAKSSTSTSNTYAIAGGGAGWYGGGYSRRGAGGGGSGWVNISSNASYRPSGYIGIQLDAGVTQNGNTSFPSPSGGNETGHTSNGYVRITKGGSLSDAVFAYYQDGSMRPYETADSNAIGVAVILDNYSCVIDKYNANNGNTCDFGALNVDLITAGADHAMMFGNGGTLNGATSTTAIINASSDTPAARAARAAFGGAGYLPTVGEWKAVFGNELYSATVNAMLTKIGGTVIDSSHYWTSSVDDGRYDEDDPVNNGKGQIFTGDDEGVKAWKDRFSTEFVRAFRTL